MLGKATVLCFDVATGYLMCHEENQVPGYGWCVDVKLVCVFFVLMMPVVFLLQSMVTLSDMTAAKMVHHSFQQK